MAQRKIFPFEGGGREHTEIGDAFGSSTGSAHCILTYTSSTCIVAEPGIELGGGIQNDQYAATVRKKMFDPSN